MKSWIAVWIGMFAAVMLLAMLSDKGNRKKNLPMILLMVAVVAISTWLSLFH